MRRRTITLTWTKMTNKASVRTHRGGDTVLIPIRCNIVNRLELPITDHPDGEQKNNEL